MYKLIGIVAVVLALMGFMAPAAMAQEDIESESVFYEAEEQQPEGGHWYVIAVQFANEEGQVQDFMDQVDPEEEITDFVEGTFGAEVLHVTEEDEPKAGDEAIAVTAHIDLQGRSAEVVLMYIAYDDYLYLYVGGGQSDVYEELIEIVEEFHEEDPEGDLPPLTLFPDGFTLVEPEEEDAAGQVG